MIYFTHQIIPIELRILYVRLLKTFLVFDILNYFIQLPNKQRKIKKIINLNNTK